MAKYEKKSESDAVMLNSVFSNSVMIYGIVWSRNNLTCQKNTPWKANKIISESKIVLREPTGKKERKT